MLASEVIKIAEAEVGYLEKASNSNLDSKIGNAGSNNWTKYARDLFAAGYYNGNKNGYAWCDVFVDWCVWNAAGKSKTKAETVECQTGDLGAGCVYSARYYRNAGRFDKNPKVGDQIFFGDVGDEYHTGLVYAVADGYVYTIEGNTNGGSDVVANGGGVFKKKYKIGSSSIAGYGHPKYDSEPTVVIKPVEGEITCINGARNTDYLVLLIGKTSTGFNKWGVDVIFDAKGNVKQVINGGENSNIPKDCYCLSGHGKNATYLINKYKIGSKVVF